MYATLTIHLNIYDQSIITAIREGKTSQKLTLLNEHTLSIDININDADALRKEIKDIYSGFIINVPEWNKLYYVPSSAILGISAFISSGNVIPF